MAGGARSRFIGSFSSTLGDAGINIAAFHFGRDAASANALMEVDGEIPGSRKLHRQR